ncbi:MAG: aldo/keto reductase, partial [Saprospiraceae bacterium]|nr:aldo/keto reductase [Saprospiraceae bacterium]
MNYRKFGTTDLQVSEIGFGAWAIGGPAEVGGIPIGWGNSDDTQSVLAIRQALDRGINFFDTADFYGLGHSEELLGKELATENDVIIASKVGHRKSPENTIVLDYTYDYIISACESSLRRLGRDHIDYYQLHTAKVADLQNEAGIRAMDKLTKDGKIRYWGVSLNTFNPFPEADYLIKHKLGQGFQLVLNIINQKALPIVTTASENKFGVIARMPLQFGLLTGKFSKDTTFEKSDHRSFRLTPLILEKSLKALEPIWDMTEKYQTTKLGLSLSYILSYPGVSTVIPGLRTAEQVRQNADHVVQLADEDRVFIESLFEEKFDELLA